MRKQCAIVGVGLLALAMALCAAASELLGVPGTQAHRIEEPVFKGHAYVYEAGTENAPAILLVHGIGDNIARDFADHIAWLSHSYHVVVVDLPGFGQSDKANVLYSPTNYAAFLKYVVDRFVRKPFTLVGHSMGGVVALRYAASYPAEVERLVVIDAPGLLHRYAFSSHALAKLGFDFLPPAIDPLSGFARLARKLMGRIERTSFDPEAVLNSPTLRQTVLGGDPGRIAGLAVALDDLSPHVHKLTMPTLVIWGGQDMIAPLRTGKMLVRALPQARLAVIESAGHVPMEETPEQFRAVLESFLVSGLPAVPPAVIMERHGSVRCVGQKNLVFEGEFERLALNGCKDAHIRNARIGELQLNNSTATIDDSYIGGGGVGMYAVDSSAELSNVRIEADVAIFANSSRFDVAGAEIEAKQAVMRVGKPSIIAFSLCRVKSPMFNGLVHYFYSVTGEKPI